MSEFNKWYERQELLAKEEMGEMPDLHDNFVLKNMCGHVWNYQQSKIETLESKLSQSIEREEKLRECVGGFISLEKTQQDYRLGGLIQKIKRAKQYLKQIEGESNDG